jgi:hypothetical protein
MLPFRLVAARSVGHFELSAPEPTIYFVFPTSSGPLDPARRVDLVIPFPPSP